MSVVGAGLATSTMSMVWPSSIDTSSTATPMLGRGSAWAGKNPAPPAPVGTSAAASATWPGTDGPMISAVVSFSAIV